MAGTKERCLMTMTHQAIDGVSRQTTPWFLTVGSALEYYDFIIYALCAPYIGHAFFGAYDVSTSLTYTFIVFSTGYLARPIGGLLAGYLSDKADRQRVFSLTLLLMALSTFTIGCLPAQQLGVIGGLVAFIVLVCRFFQGLSFGAELPGAMTIARETAPQSKRGIWSGFIISSTTVGALTASVIMAFMTQTLGSEAMYDWGWRVPFWLGGLLALWGVWARFNYSVESGKTKPQTHSLSVLFQSHKSYMAVSLWLACPVALLITGGLYMPTYLKVYQSVAAPLVFKAQTAGLVLSMLCAPLWGWFGHKVGYARLLTSLLCITAVMMVVLGVTLNKPSIILVYGGFLLYQLCLTGLIVTYFTHITDILPPVLRYSLLALTYNVVYSVLSLLPAFMTMLIKTTGQPSVFFTFLAAGMSFGLIGLFMENRLTKAL
jgi:MFS family permease